MREGVLESLGADIRVRVPAHEVGRLSHVGGGGWGTGLLGRRVGVHVDVAFSGSSWATSVFSCPAGVCGP